MIGKQALTYLQKLDVRADVPPRSPSVSSLEVVYEGPKLPAPPTLCLSQLCCAVPVFWK